MATAGRDDGRRRVAAVTALSFSSGLPLGLVWIAVPAWMTSIGVDIRLVGFFSLAQAPWTFKVFWAPLLDRFRLPVLGRRRGWILLTQAALLAGFLGLASVADAAASRVALVGLLSLGIAFLAATQDIAVDAYAVETLHDDEQGVAVGARTAMYRAAMAVAGTLTITLAAPRWIGSWSLVLGGLALCFVPLMLVTLAAPEPDRPAAPPQTLQDAVWEPLRGFLGQPRALEILAFVMLFKMSDHLTQALTRPFLIQLGISGTHVGVGSGTAELIAVLVGTFLGGLLTNAVGLGRALWITGVLQMGSNLGYAALAAAGPNVPLMYVAVLVEMVTTGLGTGAFGVLLLRLTEKRFSATQFAMLSSLAALPRIAAGPVAGLVAASLGWFWFFVFTVFTGIPGLVMLHRFVPWGSGMERTSRG